MSRGEILSQLAAADDEALGDVLLQLAVDWWLEQDSTPDEIIYLVEQVLEETEPSND